MSFEVPEGYVIIPEKLTQKRLLEHFYDHHGDLNKNELFGYIMYLEREATNENEDT